MVFAFRFGNDRFDKIINLPAYMKRVSGSSNTQVTGGWVAGIIARQMVDAWYADRVTVGFSGRVEELDQMLLTKFPN